LIPAASMTLPERSISARINVSNRSGVQAAGGLGELAQIVQRQPEA
jgi:hypothetical protein